MIKKNFFINSSFVLLIFLLDRISKIYVTYLDKEFLGSKIFSSKYLNINLVWNDLLMILKSSGLYQFALIMILGGALGNVFDRILYKAVPDFIDFHVGNFHWFIFNIADIFITLGVIFMIMLEFINNKENK